MTGTNNKTRNKIISLELLKPILDAARVEGRKIVQCHGVFDLLHIGHIRHFNEARSLGDILVVTLTADKFVNKGPFRPAFPEDVRAECLADLESVDYVAINRSSSAEETIRFLRPDFYVKGSDYKDAGKDVTGGILREREAVEAGGGVLHFTSDITHSSSHLINRHFSRHSDETQLYLSELASRYTPDRVFEYLEKLRALKVLIVGEAIIDEYQYATALGKSAKDPILAVKLLHSEKFAGGVLAVANNLANFCEAPTVLSLLGDRDSQEDLIQRSLHPDIKPIFLRRKDSPTVLKRRIIDHYSFTKMISLYDWNDSPLDQEDDRALCKALSAQIENHDIVLVVDYGHSMMTSSAVEILCRRARFLAVNAQSNAGNIGYQSVSKYPRADLVCIASQELRQEIRNRVDPVEDLVKDLHQKCDYENIIITHGKMGALYQDKSGPRFTAPALADRVTDRIGGGDAFLSVAAPAVAAHVPPDLVCFLGNAVAAQAVATVGHRESINKASL
ncbi:MAG: PfkB family carbohydrate kinase, partial [Candidatus Hydrogenedentota bacterium]